MMLAYRPRTGYWAQALDQVQNSIGFADRLILDVCRLRRVVGVLFSADDYIAMADRAGNAGFPGEAKRVLEEGFRRSLLGGISPDGVGHRRLLDAATKKAKVEDSWHLRPLVGRDGDALAAFGFSLALDQQSERSVIALEKAVVQSDLSSPEDVRFRLGLAQLWAGHRSDAERTLRAVRSEDGTKELVRLWLLIAKNLK